MTHDVCVYCHQPLPAEHWRVLAEHTDCRPPEPERPEPNHADSTASVQAIAWQVRKRLNRANRQLERYDRRGDRNALVKAKQFINEVGKWL